MAQWDYTLNVKDIWNNFEDMGFEKARDAIVTRIKESEFYADEWTTSLDDAVAGMEDSEDLRDFNYYWNDFYNYADAYRIWVKTF